MGGFRYPDAIGRDVRFIAVSDDQTIYDFGVCVVEGQILLAFGCDNGGVHWNSTILSHAFYLATEGGQHRTTGRTVQQPVVKRRLCVSNSQCSRCIQA